MSKCRCTCLVEQETQFSQFRIIRCPLHAASPELYAACKVVELDPEISAWLSDNDPKALEQIRAALAKADGKDSPCDA